MASTQPGIVVPTLIAYMAGAADEALFQTIRKGCSGHGNAGQQRGPITSCYR